MSPNAYTVFPIKKLNVWVQVTSYARATAPVKNDPTSSKPEQSLGRIVSTLGSAATSKLLLRWESLVRAPEGSSMTTRKIMMLIAHASNTVPHIPNKGIRKYVDNRTPDAPPNVFEA